MDGAGALTVFWEVVRREQAVNSVPRLSMVELHVLSPAEQGFGLGQLDRRAEDVTVRRGGDRLDADGGEVRGDGGKVLVTVKKAMANAGVREVGAFVSLTSTAGATSACTSSFVRWFP
jgi:hypothetical protein